MARTIDLRKKSEELRTILRKYNGLPSQKEDKAAHLNIKYYIKSYPDEPEIKALIDEFNLTESKKYFKDFDSHLERIKAILEERKAMPQSSQEKTLYGFVKDFFKKYRDVPEVEKLKFQYAGPSCFPLPESAYGKLNAPEGKGAAMIKWRDWKSDVAFEYVVYVWKRFGILPAENTKPMQEVRYKIHYYCRYNGKKSRQGEIDSLFAFSKLMEEFECKDKTLCSFHHCQEFDSEEVQQRVRNIVIENGSCAIRYIAEMAIPGVSLPVEYVYYYYYTCAHDKDDYWTIRPLGFIYVVDGDYGQYFLRVHYRDYYMVDVNMIRQSARANYRDWSDNPPQTIDDWKYFGQWGLFVGDYGYKEGSQLKLLREDWSETIIDHALKRSERYFYVYDRFKYLDYLLFLLENDYELYVSDVTGWVQGWYNYEGRAPEDNSIRQKVKSMLEQRGIDLKGLRRFEQL